MAFCVEEGNLLRICQCHLYAVIKSGEFLGTHNLVSQIRTYARD